MCWEVKEYSNRKAIKEYHCQAYGFINNSGLGDDDFSPEEAATIAQAAAEDYKILPGTKYVRIRGKWEGEWITFRARIDLDDICMRYRLYEDSC